ncbi:hypothetical protein BKA83DRAFT_115944 [Pisolithus microcarpus]|nr:hypothetical protein BKA83DRAFT_115944 [Pisolithus microcarpus]
MSCHDIPASPPATPLATSVTSPEGPRIKPFRSAMERYALTVQEVRKRAIEVYGSAERAMKAMQIGEAENKAAIEKTRFNGHAGIRIGCKPKPGEEVKFSQLRDDLMVRVWGGDLERYEYYCLDFVNHERQHILTPDDVKIYTLATALSPSARVLSVEDSLEKANAKSLYSHATRRDPNWETYVIREGTVLRITQQNRPDRFLHIPIRAARNSTLVLQPW